MRSNLFLLTVLLACGAFHASAELRVVRLNPPLFIGASEVEDSESGLGVRGIDFNLDGHMDLRLVYGPGGIQAFLNPSNRVVTHGSLAAVPFDTVIGSNLPVALTNYHWWRDCPVRQCPAVHCRPRLSAPDTSSAKRA